jgi:hypothetical protein
MEKTATKKRNLFTLLFLQFKFHFAEKKREKPLQLGVHARLFGRHREHGPIFVVDHFADKVVLLGGEEIDSL